MNLRNLFFFIVDHLKQRGGKGRAVIIVRTTPVEEVAKQFDAMLSDPAVSAVAQYRKETSPDYPEMLIYFSPNNEEHIVFGRSEQGWKDDYGLTHNDVVVSVL